MLTRSRKRPKRDLVPIDTLPNRGSPHRTPASLHLDIHYAKLRIRERWNWERYCRLAAFLRYTPYELGSLCCIPHVAISRAEMTNQFTPTAALVLTLLEAHFCTAFTKDIIEQPFPNLNEVPSSPHARPQGT